MPVRFRLPAFYPILDTVAIRSRGGSVLPVATALIDAGAGIIQYRHKERWTQLDYDEAAAVCEKCRAAKVPFVLNDRADFARLLNAGLHIGQDDLHPVPARAVIGSDCVLGFSTHNRRQVHNASSEPVDYLAIGPVFSTSSKAKPDPVLGLDALAAVRKLTLKPLVAIGGITLALAPDVLAAGADSVAVISGFLTVACHPQAIAASVRDWLLVCREADRN